MARPRRPAQWTNLASALYRHGVSKQHDYTTRIVWTGNRGEGTKTYRGYDRSWDIATPGKPIIHCSNDPVLGGDPTLSNPEDLLLSSLSACHMLWYLHGERLRHHGSALSG